MLFIVVVVHIKLWLHRTQLFGVCLHPNHTKLHTKHKNGIGPSSSPYTDYIYSTHTPSLSFSLSCSHSCTPSLSLSLSLTLSEVIMLWHVVV